MLIFLQVQEPQTLLEEVVRVSIFLIGEATSKGEQGVYEDRRTVPLSAVPKVFEKMLLA